MQAYATVMLIDEWTVALPEIEFERLVARLEDDGMGWYRCTDVDGAEVMFRLHEIRVLYCHDEAAFQRFQERKRRELAEDQEDEPWKSI